MKTQGKPLAEMTLEELWQLFPIFLTEHKSHWASWYDEEVGYLKSILPQGLTYAHIGSTAVDGIMAKPIVDILIVANVTEQAQQAADILRKHGYLIMSASDKRISLNKGYTENGFAEKVFHLHIRLEGDTDEMYFCEYLQTHPDVAKAYERLKRRLCKKYEHDRDGYTNAKSDFVTKYTAMAKRDAGIDGLPSATAVLP